MAGGGGGSGGRVVQQEGREWIGRIVNGNHEWDAAARVVVYEHARCSGHPEWGHPVTRHKVLPISGRGSCHGHQSDCAKQRDEHPAKTQNKKKETQNRFIAL